MYLERKDRRSALIENPFCADDAEELAFIISQIILSYLPTNPLINDYSGVLGALAIVNAEFVQKGVLTYLNEQEMLNGDIGFGDLPQNRN